MVCDTGEDWWVMLESLPDYALNHVRSSEL